MRKVASLDAKRYTSSASRTGSDVKLATWASTWSDRHHDGVPWELLRNFSVNIRVTKRDCYVAGASKTLFPQPAMAKTTVLFASRPSNLRLINVIRNVEVVNSRPVVRIKESLNRVGT